MTDVIGAGAEWNIFVVNSGTCFTVPRCLIPLCPDGFAGCSCAFSPHFHWLITCIYGYMVDCIFVDDGTKLYKEDGI